MTSHVTHLIRRGAAVLTAVVVLGCEGAPIAPPVTLPETTRDLQLTELFQETSFHQVLDLLPTEEGTWILSRDDRPLTFISRDGATHRFSRRGQGPGEMMFATALTPTGDDGVEVWDFGNRRRMALNSDGALRDDSRMDVTFSRAVRSDLPDVTFANPFKVRRVGSTVVAAHFEDPVTRPHDLRRAELVLGDAELNPSRAPRTIQAMADADLPAPPQGHVPVPLWESCGTELLVVMDPDARTLSWFDNGRAVGTVDLPFPERNLTEAERLAYVHYMIELEAGLEALDDPEILADAEAMAHEGSGMFPRQAPPASGLLCLTDGSVLVREFDASEHPLGHSTRWTWMDRDGQILDRVHFPIAFTPMAVHGRMVWGVYTSPITDLQTVGGLNLTPPFQVAMN
jgi:hypothetical protein